MRRVALLLCATLAGCAAPAPPAPKPPPVEVNTLAPRCTAPKQCEAMWLQAQEVVQFTTGMRLRIVTESRLETFAPTGYGRMGAAVLKYPIGDGYELRVSFECYRSIDCTDQRNSATNLFNLRVGGAASMK